MVERLGLMGQGLRLEGLCFCIKNLRSSSSGCYIFDKNAGILGEKEGSRSARQLQVGRVQKS